MDNPIMDTNDAPVVDHDLRRADVGHADSTAPATNPPVDEAPANPRMEVKAQIPDGMVDLYGRHEAAGCWIFIGWLAREWLAMESPVVDAVFERGRAEGDSLFAFHEREDLGTFGIGYVLIVQVPPRRLGRLLRLEVRHGEIAVQAPPSKQAREAPEQAIVSQARRQLATCLPNPNLEAMDSRLSRRFVGEGYIDFFGHRPLSRGWFVGGWLSNDFIKAVASPVEAQAQFEAGAIGGEAIHTYFEREDIVGKGLGVVLFVPAERGDLGRLVSLTLRSGTAVLVARPSRNAGAVPPDTLTANIVGLLEQADSGPASAALIDLATRTAPAKSGALAAQPNRVFVELDEVIDCAPEGLLLFGWMLARTGDVAAIRLRSGEKAFPVDMVARALWIDRNDVVESVGREHGFDDPRCGFIVRAAPAPAWAETLSLEVELSGGEVITRLLPRPRLDGVAAIKRLLGAFDAHYADVDSLYGQLFGPAVGALNQRRLADAPRVQALQFGHLIRAPRCSVIVPLYGRIDFMEFQMALFAVRGIAPDTEIIYVLDDPPRAREAQFLAASLFARFGLSFRLLLLSHNVGFAPANNIGFNASKGQYVCLMNSDVFPITGDWLERLTAHLEQDPTLGLVGPVLLFEDGSVQHEGMVFKAIPQFGGWAFGQHRRKGFRRAPARGLVRETVITGACMVMRRVDAPAHGVFDEAFIIGDFEDTDLCFRLRASGLGAAIDSDVAMYHLERKSQASSANLWRTNLTLYNAWVHQRRWGAEIARLGCAP